MSNKYNTPIQVDNEAQMNFTSIIKVTKQCNAMLKLKSNRVFLQTDDDGRVGNVLCAYSSLMVTFLNDLTLESSC